MGASGNKDNGYLYLHVKSEMKRQKELSMGSKLTERFCMFYADFFHPDALHCRRVLSRLRWSLRNLIANFQTIRK
jgi:hypothetical protein